MPPNISATAQNKPNSDDHPFRTFQYIEEDPPKYLFTGDSKHEWEAIAEVCRGHASEELVPLSSITEELADIRLCRAPINLRWVTALLRLADEIDDTYTRINAGYRKHVDLVQITKEMITFHFDNKDAKWQECCKIVSEKRDILETGMEYLRQKNMHRGLYIRPKAPELSVTRTRQEIRCLLPIEVAMAAETDVEPDAFRWGRHFWPDVEKLYKRDECDKLLLLLREPNGKVILLEGYPASGKSSLVCRLAYDLVKSGKKVYYGNLTTWIGLHNCPREEIPSRLLDEAQAVSQETCIIIEDIHHLLDDFDRLNPLTRNPHIKLVLTSRPLEEYEIRGGLRTPFKDETELFQWITSEHNIKLENDEELVRKILEHGSLQFDDVKPIMDIIADSNNGEKKPNLLLLSFLIEASKRKYKNVDKIQHKEILYLVRKHLKKLRNRVCESSTDERCYWRLVETLSTFSEFEVPTEEEFFSIVVPKGFSPVQILEELEKGKEIVSFKKYHPGFRKYYLVPHSKLASLYRAACVVPTERPNLLKQYLINGEFFGTLICELLRKARNPLFSQINDLLNDLTGRDLSGASLEEIGFFLWRISITDKKLAQQIASNQRDTLKEKLAGVSDLEIAFSLGLIYNMDKKLARQIAHEHREALKSKGFTDNEIDNLI